LNQLPAGEPAILETSHHVVNDRLHGILSLLFALVGR